MFKHSVARTKAITPTGINDVDSRIPQMERGETDSNNSAKFTGSSSFSWLLLLAALVIASEVLLRIPAVVDVLPDPTPRLWHALLVQDKLDYLAAAAEVKNIDVLFIGNSTTQAGVNPSAFDTARVSTINEDAERKDGSFNAAIEGLPPFGTELFLPIYLKRMQPEVIVYGLSAQDLNSNSPWAMDVTDRVNHSPLVLAESERGWRGRFLALLLRYSQLYRYRPILMQTLMTGTIQESHLEEAYFDGRGHDAIDRRLSDLSPGERGHLYNKAGVLNYSSTGTQLKSLRAVIEDTQALGIQLILVNMPLADDYYANFDQVSDYAHYLNELNTVAAETNVPLWDMEGPDPDFEYQPFADQEFADLNHLNAVGAERLSRLLAQRYLRMQSE